MSGHTPGPWLFDPKNTGRDFDIGYGIHTERCGYSIAHIPCSERDGGSPEANALLIAAAPDLLEALREMVGRFESPDETPDYVKRARAAIAKAEGK